MDIKKIIEKISYQLFPHDLSCIACTKDIQDFDTLPLCDKCKKEYYLDGKYCTVCNDIVYGSELICEKCQKHPKHFRRAVTPFVYKDAIARQINGFKNRNHKYLKDAFAIAINAKLKEKNIDYDIITYMPISPTRLKQRGYNQAELIAKSLSKITGKPAMECLKKVRDTKEQKSLSFTLRQNNLKGAFELVLKKEIKGKTILLIDDVITTCASLDTASAELLKSAKSVYCAGVARTILSVKKNSNMITLRRK